MKRMLWLAAVVLAGCASVRDCAESGDPIVGNWGLKLGYAKMNSGHMIASRNAAGEAEALVLWRWGSPTPMKNVCFCGNKLKFESPNGFRFEGTVENGVLEGVATKTNGCVETTVTGWKNPPICEGVSTADAKFGEPIDLLKDGLDGWKVMETDVKNGWKFDKGVLSNQLGRNEKGQWIGGGANLMTKRDDFYDFKLSYDVRVPEGSNSGVYLRGRYECQVLDTYGKPVDCHNMAAYYGRVTPSVAAEKPAGEWQHVDVTLYKRHLTVVLNGTTIIDNVPVVGITGGALDADEFKPGPIYLQGDHSDADFRNMILYPAL